MILDSYISGFISAIVIAFIGALFGYVFSEHQRRRERFNKAAAEFQSAFFEAKQKLRYDPRADFKEILNSQTLLLHEKAAMRFKLFLSAKERFFFDLDWNTYLPHALHPGERHPPEKQAEEWENEDNCKVFLGQIERLFSHAKLR